MMIRGYKISELPRVLMCALVRGMTQKGGREKRGVGLRRDCGLSLNPETFWRMEEKVMKE